MRVAIEGCAHGELDNIYETIRILEQKEGYKVDLLICCGDFQSSRNEQDLRCMAVPPKYAKMCTFYKYYTGVKVAPILTIFIGGNHEASNYLQELPYGGWVAPNIYYLGYAGVIDIGGVRIGGISGIYKGKDYARGHFEKVPYDEGALRSVYHIRNLEVFRLKQLKGQFDFFLSHDWPSGVWKHGDCDQLVRYKPHFTSDIESGDLGSKPTWDLLEALKPSYWFSAHLHCKFAALIPHSDGKNNTKFLALDKCLPGKRFLQIIELPQSGDVKIKYDLEWLTVLRLTNHLLSVKNLTVYMPGPGSSERYSFTPTEEEKSDTLTLFEGDLTVPLNFEMTALGYVEGSVINKSGNFHLQPLPVCNPQTVSFCDRLRIDDPLVLLIPDFIQTSSKNSSFNILVNDTSIKHCGSTFINDTTTCDVSARTSLVLPEPQFEASGSEVEFFIDSGATSEGRCVDSGPVSVEKDKEESEVVDSTAASPVKRLRRRNFDIYNNQDD